MDFEKQDKVTTMGITICRQHKRDENNETHIVTFQHKLCPFLLVSQGLVQLFKQQTLHWDINMRITSL